MPAGEKDPKADTDPKRKDQAAKMVLKELRKSRPEFGEGYVDVVWAQAGRGSGDWRALVVVQTPDPLIYQVGYNYDADTMYVDVVGRPQE